MYFWRYDIYISAMEFILLAWYLYCCHGNYTGAIVNILVLYYLYLCPGIYIVALVFILGHGIYIGAMVFILVICCLHWCHCIGIGGMLIILLLWYSYWSYSTGKHQNYHLVLKGSLLVLFSTFFGSLVLFANLQISKSPIGPIKKYGDAL